jgi:hypothetical protein
MDYPQKSLALLLAVCPITGLIGLDKFYIGNVTLGFIQSFLALSKNIHISFIFNIFTIGILLINIFTNVNFFTNFANSTKYDYMIGIVVLLYMITKIKIIFFIDNKLAEKKSHTYYTKNVIY